MCNVKRSHYHSALTAVTPSSHIALITAVSVVYSLTVCEAALATFAPARFVNGLRSTAVAVLAMAAVVGGGVFILFELHTFI